PFVIAENTTELENDLVSRAVGWLRTAVPAGWTVDINSTAYGIPNLPEPQRLDRAIDITTNQSMRGTLIVEAKRSFTPRDADVFSQPLARQLRTVSHNAPILVVSEWLGQRTRELLEEQGISYLDLTGNALIRLDNPAMFIRSMGSARAPKPVQRGTVRLRGAKAGRVLRLLVDVRPPFGVREIASVTEVAVSYVSHLLDFLDQEALIERSKRGRVESVDIPRLLRRWGTEYDVYRTNQTSSYVARQGAQQVLEQIRGDAALGDAVVVTGSFAAVRLAPVAAPALLTLYSNDPDALAVPLDLLPADEGSNVALLRPYDRVVWDRTSTEDGISYAAPSQVAVDCLTGNGRMPAEGEALLTWMTGNESTWRLPALPKEAVTPKS
ncbi:MAG TPA: hypothetical protein VNG12_20410, partial [Acidimicrobiales bacterium]|nr:hypothetical protein [Acidimicrobiales bacterium]